jgi:hypothetical protein
MRTNLKVLACLTGVLFPCLFAIPGTASADETFTKTKVISVPGGLGSFDIGFVDADIHTYVLADRTNKAIDVVDTNTNTVTTQLTGCGPKVASPTPPTCSVFVGGSGAKGGPNGVIIVDHKEVWAGDGNSHIVAINMADNSLLLNATTGGSQRADELCEDVGHEVVLIANDEAVDSFVTFWSTETHAMVGKIVFKAGGLNNTKNIVANGIEQCKFNPRTNRFYLAIPDVGGGNGAVVTFARTAPFLVIDEILIPASSGCAGPQGLAIGPNHEIQLGCAGTSSLMIDDRSTSTNTIIIANEAGEGGADEAWYNPGDNQYFIAESNNTPPSFGVVDRGGHKDASVPTQAGSHSIAVDMLKNQVYIPVNSGGGLCGATSTTGCIAVFTATGKDDKCLASGMPVLDHDDGDDPVFMRTRCDDDRRADRDDHDRDR